MKHRVTNQGGLPITVIDSDGHANHISGGGTFVGEVHSIVHGDNPAHYTMQPVFRRRRRALSAQKKPKAKASR